MLRSNLKSPDSTFLKRSPAATLAVICIVVLVPASLLGQTPEGPRWVFEGTATGGEFTATVNDCPIRVETVDGLSAESMAVNLAETVNFDACLQAQGILAVPFQTSAVLQGPEIEVTASRLDDSGLRFLFYPGAMQNSRAVLPFVVCNSDLDTGIAVTNTSSQPGTISFLFLATTTDRQTIVTLNTSSLADTGVGLTDSGMLMPGQTYRVLASELCTMADLPDYVGSLELETGFGGATVASGVLGPGLPILVFPVGGALPVGEVNFECICRCRCRGAPPLPFFPLVDVEAGMTFPCYSSSCQDAEGKSCQFAVDSSLLFPFPPRIGPGEITVSGTVRGCTCSFQEQ